MLKSGRSAAALSVGIPGYYQVGFIYLRTRPMQKSRSRIGLLPIVHVSRFSKFKFFSPIPTPAISRLHSQSINGRHLAVALATTFTLNLCLFPKFPPKSMYHCPPSSDNVKNPKPMSKTRNRKYTYRPPLSTDSNHLPSVGSLARTKTLGR